MALDAVGNAIAVWQENVGASVRNAVWASRYGAGAGWTAAATIDAPVGNSAAPQLAISRRTGGAWSTPVRVVAGISEAGTLRLAGDADGNAMAVWHERPAIRNEVHVARFDIASGRWSAPVRLDDGMRDASQPELAVTAAGDALVVWVESSELGVGTGLASNRFVSGTQAWIGATRVQPAGASPGTSPALALNDSGIGMAVWLQPATGQATKLEAWAAAFDTSTGAWAEPARLMVDASAYADGGTAQRPQVALNASGEAVAVWAQRDAANLAHNIWSRVYR